MSGDREGQCPGCGHWVALDDEDRLRTHDPNGGVYSHALAISSHLQCEWGGRRPPETRARQMEIRT
jgi:hypothetical protein